LIKFIGEIGVDAEDVVMLVISYYFEAKTMGKYTKDEFCKGMSKLGYTTAEDVKKNLSGLRAKMNN